MSFSKEINNQFDIKFLDSFCFMSESLSTLAYNLSEEKTRYKDTLKMLPSNVIDLVTRKGVFPFEYVNSWKNLTETTLQPKTIFYNSLTNENISDADYAHAQKGWTIFKISNLGEYSDLYLVTDVLIFTDVFENFREICLNTLNLDPSRFISSPSLAFQAMLKYTNIKLERLKDYVMHLVLEQGIRGGICQAVKRYYKTNLPNISGFE